MNYYNKIVQYSGYLASALFISVNVAKKIAIVTILINNTLKEVEYFMYGLSILLSLLALDHRNYLSSLHA